MFNTIILLAACEEYHLALTALLREHNPGLSVCAGSDASDLDTLEPELLRNARLVCFDGEITLDDDLLAQIGHGAYQFYAAPLQYPGLPPEPHRAFDDGPCMSVIAQALTERPSDQIVGLETFVIPPGIETPQRDRLVFSRLAHLFWQMSRAIACDSRLNGLGTSSATRH